MDNTSKLVLAFGAGLLVGAGVVALCTTEEGKAAMKKAGEKLNDLAEDVKKSMGDLEKELADFLRTAAKEGPAA